MESSLERIDPDRLASDETTGAATLQLHLQRYHYAGRFLIKGTCADIACGIGYGAYLLATEYADSINRIVAVDLDEAAIKRARSRYAHPLIEFLVGDAMLFRPAFPLQNIVSLETIEHLPDPANFVLNISKHLVNGGRFIASVPITPSMDANPYHLHDFSKTSFRKLFEDAGLTMIDSFVQKQSYQLFSILNKKEERSKDLRKGLMSYYLRHPSKFFLRMSSLLTDGFTNKYLVAVFEKL
jgi:2-polyprenyl-3-methyl-5-hydroxy-6-metoxy-1,4-benzoquinol methylase